MRVILQKDARFHEALVVGEPIGAVGIEFRGKERRIIELACDQTTFSFLRDAAAARMPARSHSCT